MTAWATGEEVGGDAPASRVVGGVARGGGRRFPAPFPARRPQGSAPTGPVGAPVRVVLDGARTVSSSAGKMSMRRARWWWRRVGVGDVAPRRSPPGAHKGAPVRVVSDGARTGCVGWRPYGFCRAARTGCVGGARTGCVGWRPYGFILCGEDVYAARVLVVASRGGGRRCPPPGPARRPQGSAPTGPVGWRPYGLCRMAPVRVVSDGARTGCVGWHPYGLCRAARTGCVGWRLYGSIPCGEDVYAARVGVAARVGILRMAPNGEGILGIAQLRGLAPEAETGDAQGYW